MSVRWQLVPIDILFAGTFGGVFRYTDNGDHGIAVNNGLDFRLYLTGQLTQMETSSAGTFEGCSVYRSADDGENWTLIDNG